VEEAEDSAAEPGPGLEVYGDSAYGSGDARAASRTVTFGPVCADCPLRQRCTTAKDGRSMTIHPHDGLLRAARAQARTDEFQRAYPTRSSIERTIAWTATQNGLRAATAPLAGPPKPPRPLPGRASAGNARPQRTTASPGLPEATQPDPGCSEGS
jgi:hypothetical protein